MKIIMQHVCVQIYIYIYIFIHIKNIKKMQYMLEKSKNKQKRGLDKVNFFFNNFDRI